MPAPPVANGADAVRPGPGSAAGPPGRRSPPQPGCGRAGPAPTCTRPPPCRRCGRSPAGSAPRRPRRPSRSGRPCARGARTCSSCPGRPDQRRHRADRLDACGSAAPWRSASVLTMVEGRPCHRVHPGGRGVATRCHAVLAPTRVRLDVAARRRPAHTGRRVSRAFGGGAARGLRPSCRSSTRTCHHAGPGLMIAHDAAATESEGGPR